MRVYISLLLLLLVLPAALLGCGGAGKNGGVTMSEREIPAIDRAAPAATATATFALG